MKQVLATILAVLYLATSSGATVSIHYCMGQVVAKSMAKKEECGKCGMEKKGGCCEDQVKVVKTQDNHSFQTADLSFTPFIAVLQANYLTIPPASVCTLPVFPTHNNSPPAASGISICILHCVFRL